MIDSVRNMPALNLETSAFGNRQHLLPQGPLQMLLLPLTSAPLIFFSLSLSFVSPHSFKPRLTMVKPILFYRPLAAKPLSSDPMTSEGCTMYLLSASAPCLNKNHNYCGYVVTVLNLIDEKIPRGAREYSAKRYCLQGS